MSDEQCPQEPKVNIQLTTEINSALESDRVEVTSGTTTTEINTALQMTQPSQVPDVVEATSETTTASSTTENNSASQMRQPSLESNLVEATSGTSTASLESDVIEVTSGTTNIENNTALQMTQPSLESEVVEVTSGTNTTESNSVLQTTQPSLESAVVEATSGITTAPLESDGVVVTSGTTNSCTESNISLQITQSSLELAVVEAPSGTTTASLESDVVEVTSGTTIKNATTESNTTLQMNQPSLESDVVQATSETTTASTTENNASLQIIQSSLESDVVEATSGTAVVEVTSRTTTAATTTKTERLPKLKASQRRKLKTLRAMGVDTSKILVPRNEPFDINGVASLKRPAEENTSESKRKKLNSTSDSLESIANIQPTNEKNTDLQMSQPSLESDVVEVASGTKIERLPKLKASQRRKLKTLRAMGVDTSKILVPRDRPFEPIIHPTTGNNTALQTTQPKPIANTQPTTENNTGLQMAQSAPLANIQLTTADNTALPSESSLRSDADEATSGIKKKRTPPLTTAQKRKLKKLRAMGVDTSKVLVPRNAPFDINSVASAKKAAERSISGIMAAVVLKTFPKSQMTKENAKELYQLLAAAVDKEELPAPRFECSRWMGKYQGYICADEDTFSYLKRVVEATGKYRVHQAKDLARKNKVQAEEPRSVPSEEMEVVPEPPGDRVAGQPNAE